MSHNYSNISKYLAFVCISLYGERKRIECELCEYQKTSEEAFLG